jgi:hypothetical protein
MKKNPICLLQKGPLGGSGGTVYAYRTPLVGYTVKTNTTDIELKKVGCVTYLFFEGLATRKVHKI